jgi:acetylornithine deacetylase/succinyl-diaminopimelate desuccinylase-like protein
MDITNQLNRLVSISSESPHEQKMGEYVFTLLKDLGFAVTKQYIDSERYNVLAEKGTGKKSILFYAHLDTVGVVEGWKTNPLKLTVIGDKAYGLGAWDMKAGLLANIIAIQKSDVKNIKLKLVFCVDEEYISKGGHAFIKSPFMNDVVCVISTEPAFSHGIQGVVTGRIGRAVYDVSLVGKAHHFAFYDPKKDINNALSDFIQETQKLYKKNGDKKQFVFARSIESHSIGMSLPERISLQLDSSVLPPHTHTSVLAFLKKSAKKIEKKYKSFFVLSVEKHIRETPFLEPYTVNPHDSYLEKLKKSIQAITQKRAIPYFRSSVADENIFGSHGITTLGIGPIGDNAHGANEWVSLSSIQKLTDILSHFISLADGL